MGAAFHAMEGNIGCKEQENQPPRTRKKARYTVPDPLYHELTLLISDLMFSDVIKCRIRPQIFGILFESTILFLHHCSPDIRFLVPKQIGLIENGTINGSP